MRCREHGECPWQPSPNNVLLMDGLSIFHSGSGIPCGPAGGPGREDEEKEEEDEGGSPLRPPRSSQSKGRGGAGARRRPRNEEEGVGARSEKDIEERRASRARKRHTAWSRSPPPGGLD
eukprot:4500167-Pyramimonas_sp.AAC.1